MPAYNLVVPTVNQSHCTCNGALFHIFENTNADNTVLKSIAKVETQPLNKLRLPGRQTLNKKAAKGSSTAAIA